jgi:hypothetical protein
MPLSFLTLRRIVVQSQPRQIVCKAKSQKNKNKTKKKPITKKGLVEWLKA